MDTTPSVETTWADLGDRTHSPFQANKDVYPGISRDFTMDILSEYFYSLHSDEGMSSGTESDFPIKEEFIESVFDLGDIVRVQGGPLNSWAEHYEELEGCFSKQAFEIVGMWLKKSIWKDGRVQSDGSDDKAESDNDDAKVVGDATRPLLNEKKSDVDYFEASDSLADDCWIYQLQLVDSASSTTGTFPTPDVMLWNEENLVLDADAMDGWSEDESDECDRDEAEAHAPDREAEDRSDTITEECATR